MIKDTLLISLAIAYSALLALVAYFNQNTLAVYSVIVAVVFLIASWIFGVLKPGLRNTLTTASAIVFAGFLVMISFKVIDMMR